MKSMTSLGVLAVAALAGPLASATPAAQDLPRYAAEFGPGLGGELRARALDVADFDGDGLLDLVLQRSGGRLLIGVGDGAWRDDSDQLPANFGEDMGAVAAGDLDGDGDPDLIATRAGVHEVFLNNALSFSVAGSVTSLVAIVPPSAAPEIALRLEDFDLDGNLDLLQVAGSVARLHLGDGNGQFSAAPLDLPSTLVGLIESVGVEDVTGDGRRDVLLSDQSRTQLLIANGAGGYGIGLDLPLASPVVQADFDGDGDFDLVGVHPSSGELLAYRAEASGPVAQATVPLGAGVLDLARADFGADGTADLVALLDGAAPLALLNNGALGFTVDSVAPVAGGVASATRLHALDLDADGDLDLLGLASTETTWEEGLLAFAAKTGELVRLRRDSVSYPLDDPDGLGDFNGDGRLDLVRPLGPATLAMYPNAVTSWMDQGFGRFVPAAAPPVALPFEQLNAYSAGDLDQDGKLDLLAAGRADGGGFFFHAPLAFMAGDGNGGATHVPGFAGVQGYDVESICLLDANGDGWLDAYLSNRNTSDAGAVDVALANQQGAGLKLSPFALQNYSGSSLGAESLDVDLDGDLDLFLAQRPDPMAPWLTSQDTLLINNGSGGFTDQTTARVPLQPTLTRNVEVGDFDVDGDVDMWSVVDEGGTPDAPVANGDVLMENNGGGFFGNKSGLLPALSYGDGFGAFADVNLDGELDLIELAPDASRVALYSASGFAPELELLPSDAVLPSGDLAVADMDADGDADLVHSRGLWRSQRRGLSVSSLSSLGGAARLEITTQGPPAVYLLGYALGGAWLELPPLGQLGLNLTMSFNIIGSGPVSSGHPLGVFVPVPDLPQLAGLEVHWQALVDFPLQLTRAVSRELDEL